MIAGTDNIDVLQSAADYNSLRHEWVSAGIASVIFGLIAIAAALVPAIWNSFFSVLWFLFGGFLLGEGIWLMVGRPIPVGLLSHGLVMVVVSIWNIGGSALLISLLSSEGAVYKIVFQALFTLGIFQLIWGSLSLPRYGRFHRLAIQKPSAENQQWFDRTVASISRTRPKDSKDIVVFIPGEPYARKMKGKLEEKLAIFVQGSGVDMFIAEKKDVNVIDTGNITSGKPVRATLQIRDRKIRGEFPFESFERYKTWKSGGKV